MQMQCLLQETSRRLRELDGDLARRKAEEIVLHVLGCSRSELLLHPRKTLSRLDTEAVAGIVERRLAGMPPAYALGAVYFYNREFAVSPDVLIPRPETEVLVDLVLQDETSEDALFLDMGTGSGCIAGTLLAARSRWRAVAIDRSRAALGVAARNLGARAMLLRADCADALRPSRAFDFITANLPYVSCGEMASLDASVRNFEPHAALDGGKDGLDLYRRFLPCCAGLLRPGGRLYCEIGETQEQGIRELFAALAPDFDLGCLVVHRDLCGRPRVVRAATHHT
ncbi:MAG: peptide chain release factor N(5)-glutamine methyltransferase [Chitinivibrionales bacterium]|nr:peptide chain release factor N(5)-glutamine methyltransferase [Chitinivibrionales bacterium]MBD3396712.1 peptide chain release factor N(5)-glutamine methyltransferase [Chitinivibrionales bacterium]